MLNVNEEIKMAMHNKDMAKLSVLKLIKAEFLKKSTEPGRSTKDLSYEEQIKVLMKMSAQYKDSIEQFEKANRNDLAEKEKYELSVVTEYLPKEASDDEVSEYTNKVIEDYVAQKEDGFRISMKDMKEILTIVKQKYPTANGKIVSETLKNRI